jgi:hypothetical protein
VTASGAPRRGSLREIYARLSGPETSPAEEAPDHEWDVWVSRVEADADLAGLIASAIEGERFHPGELAGYRAASERFGSCLDAASLAEAYRLLSER